LNKQAQNCASTGAGGAIAPRAAAATVLDMRMMRAATTAVATVAILSAAAHAAEPRHFYGRVVDARTGKPLPNVRVRIFNQVDMVVAALRVHPGLPNATTPSLRKPKAYVQPAATVRSDAAGRFSVRVRGVGPAEIVCDRADFAGGASVSNATAGKFLEIRYNAQRRQPSTTSPR
jgi:hypothetical protein